MIRTWIVLATLAATVVLAGGLPAALADEVTVKTIEPDKSKPPDEPKPAEQPKADPAKPATPAGDAAAPSVGDGRADRILGGLSLTAEQSAKIKPLVEPLARQIRDNREQADKKVGALFAKIRQGGDGVATAREQLGQVFDESRKASDALRKQLFEKIDPELTDAQRAKLKELQEQQANDRGRRGFGGGPGGGFGGGDMLRGMLDRAGLNLTDDQRKAVEQKVADLVRKQADEGRQMWDKMSALRDRTRKEGGDAEAQKELDELRGKSRQMMMDSMKAVRDQVAEALTPEQKQKFDEARKKAQEDRNRGMIDGVVRRTEGLGLADPQKQKVADLARAAGEAVNKLGPDDWQARDQLRQQLEKDIEALLSDEQKKKFEEAGQRRWGGFGRRGGDQQNGGNDNGGRRGGRGRGNGRGGNGGGSSPTPAGEGQPKQGT